MKKILSLLLVVSLVFCLAACGHKHKFSEPSCNSPAMCECGATYGEPLGHSFDDGISKTTECILCGIASDEIVSDKSQDDNIEDNASSTSNSQSEETQVQLSSSSDIVLASGYDENNSFFELVANETETYSGTQIKIGVIKNNEWLSQPSEKHAFVLDNGMLIGNTTLKKIKSNTNYKYTHYVGNACFVFEGVIYNCSTGMSFDKATVTGSYSSVITDFGDVNCNNRDNYLLFQKGNTVYVLNTLTMKYEELEGSYSRVCAYNDGLFYAEGPYTSGIRGFYDIDGNCVVNLADYNIVNGYLEGYQTLIFDNGLSSFKIKNDQGSIYMISINKNGEVIESNKVN